MIKWLLIAVFAALMVSGCGVAARVASKAVQEAPQAVKAVPEPRSFANEMTAPGHFLNDMPPSAKDEILNKRFKEGAETADEGSAKDLAKDGAETVIEEGLMEGVDFQGDVTDALSHMFQGHIYREGGRYQMAIEQYSQAILLDSGIEKGYLSRALAYSSLRLFLRAIEDYEKAIEQDSNDAAAYYGRGKALDNAGLTDQALRDYERACNLDIRLC